MAGIAVSGDTIMTGYSAFDEQGKPIPSSAFKMSMDGKSMRFDKARGDAATPASRKVMSQAWNCDLCNATGAAGTESTYWANTPHAGDLAFCDACVAAGKGPADARGCVQQ